MRRLILIIALMSAVPCCTYAPQAISLRRGDTMNRDHSGSRDTPEDPGGFTAPSDSTAAPEVPDSLSEPQPVFEESAPPVVYACGVEHPGAADCALVVFKDGVRIASFPAAGLPESVQEADTHFLVGADLYVAVSRAGGTDLYKNGLRLVSFADREYVTDLLVRPDGLWTLGVDVGGEGFRFRRDGSVVFSKSSGSPGRLYQDSSHLYFDYTLKTGGKPLRYLVKDGDDFALTAPGGGALLASVVSQDVLWYLEDMSGEWVLTDGDRRYSYSGRPGFAFRTAELYGTPEGPPGVVISLLALGPGFPAELVAVGDEEYFKGGGFGAYHYFDNAPNVHVTLSRDMEHLTVSGFGDTALETVEGVRFEGRRCAMQYDGQLYLCCTPLDGSAPFVWKRGNLRLAHKLEGYLTGIWVEPPN